MLNEMSKGKSEVLLPSEISLQYKAFPFAGGQITTVSQARYLGVVLSPNGILECRLKNRIQMPHASLSTMRNAKLILPGVDPTCAKIFFFCLHKDGVSHTHRKLNGLCDISLSIRRRCITRL